MDLSTCETCCHFIQHYRLEEDSCAPVNCGHCTYPRLKHRTPRTPACVHYVFRASPPALPDRNKVVYYMTTEVLQHILSYELPPIMKETLEDEGFDCIPTRF